MKTSLRIALAGILAISSSTAWAQIGDQTQVPGVPGTNTFGGLLSTPGTGTPATTNVNPGNAAGNPANAVPNGTNVIAGQFNPLGAFGTQFAPQTPQLPKGFMGGAGGGVAGSGLSVNDLIALQMLQSFGRGGVQYGAPGTNGFGGPAMGGMGGMGGMGMGGPQMPMAPQGNGRMANNNNQAMPLFNAQAQKEGWQGQGQAAGRGHPRQRGGSSRTPQDQGARG